MADMFANEDGINQRAAFWPMTGPYRAEGSDGSLPCLVVGGVQIYAYFEGGVLQVSVDCDDAAPEVLNEDRAVPWAFAVGGEVQAEDGIAAEEQCPAEKRRYYEEN